MRKAYMKDNTQPDIIMEQKVFTMYIEKAGDYVFAITQKGKANMSAQDADKYFYSDVRIYLVDVPKEKEKIENNKTKLEKGC